VVKSVIALYGSDCDSSDVADPYEYVLSANLLRRHLTAEQKRELIAKVLKANPGKSNLQIAKQVKADDKTVASVRADMVARSEIPNVEVRTDARGRQQPARRTRQSAKIAPDAPNTGEKPITITPEHVAAVLLPKTREQHLLFIYKVLDLLDISIAEFELANPLGGLIAKRRAVANAEGES
jgi:hypothetical protein